MPFFYPTYEEIKAGDRVTYHGEPGEIEFVAEKVVGNSEIDWFVAQYGGGAMVLAPKSFGRVFVNDTVKEEDLIFVSRKKT
jgi:hypothetical protein